jgi:hypothetical protein
MKITKARLQEIIKEEIDAVSEAEADGELPPNIMTVDKMIEALSKIPGDTPVAYSHEFGIMNIKNIETYDDQIYKKISYGGDWHGVPPEGTEMPRYKVVVIGA